MEARTITIIGVWAFAIIWLVGTFFTGADMLISLVLFFIAIIVSIGISAMPKAGGTESRQGS